MEEWGGLVAVVLIVLALYGLVRLVYRKERKEELRFLNDLHAKLVKAIGLRPNPTPKRRSLRGVLGVLLDINWTGFAGEYRGRHLSLAVVTRRDSEGDRVPETRVRLQVKNSAGFRLAKRRLRFDGQPREFVQRASQLICQTDPAWSAPLIKLKGSDLICHWPWTLRDVHDQLTLLDTLCDLAELAETMGSGAKIPAGRRRQQETGSPEGESTRTLVE